MPDLRNSFAVSTVTTDATPTEMVVAEIPERTMVTANLYLGAISDPGLDTWGAEASRVAKRGQSSPSLVGIIGLIINQRDLGATTWAAALDVVGNNLVVRVTGQAGTSITWGAAGTLLYVSI